MVQSSPIAEREEYGLALARKRGRKPSATTAKPLARLSFFAKAGKGIASNNVGADHAPRRYGKPVMSASANATNSLRPIVAALSPRRRRQVIATVALMLVGALAEVVSVGSILPFLAVLTNPGRIAHVHWSAGCLATCRPARTSSPSPRLASWG